MAENTDEGTGDAVGELENEIFGKEPSDEDFDPELTDDDGEPSDEDQDGEPRDKELSDDKGLSLKEQKDLQRYVSQSRDELKDSNTRLDAMNAIAGRFGGLEKMAGLLEFVGSNTKVQDLLRKQMTGSDLGIDDLDMDEMSPENKKAIALIRKIVQSDAGSLVQQALHRLQTEQINPFLAQHQEHRLEILFDRMDNEFGEDWDKHYSTMKKLAETSWDAPTKANPSWKAMKRLFHEALEETGDYDGFMEQKALDRIKSKRKSSTGGKQSASREAISPKDEEKKPAKSIFEAGARVSKRMARER